jgi:hypothetical protein
MNEGREYYIRFCEYQTIIYTLLLGMQVVINAAMYKPILRNYMELFTLCPLLIQVYRT